MPPSPALISPPRVSAPVLRSNAVMPVAGHVYSPMPGLRVWRLPFKATGLGRKVDAPPPPSPAPPAVASSHAANMVDRTGTADSGSLPESSRPAIRSPFPPGRKPPFG